MSYTGDGGEMRWLRLAATQGDAAAQYHLGAAYAGGRSVGQDDVQAHMWFNLAAAEGSEERAPERRNQVAAGMTPTQISDAQRLARNWDATHPR